MKLYHQVSKIRKITILIFKIQPSSKLGKLEPCERICRILITHNIFWKESERKGKRNKTLWRRRRIWHRWDNNPNQMRSIFSSAFPWARVSPSLFLPVCNKKKVDERAAIATAYSVNTKHINKSQRNCGRRRAEAATSTAVGRRFAAAICRLSMADTESHRFSFVSRLPHPLTSSMFFKPISLPT